MARWLDGSLARWLDGSMADGCGIPGTHISQYTPIGWSAQHMHIYAGQKMLKSDVLGPILLTSRSQGQKMLESDFLGLILTTSGAKARKCLNRNSWDLFCRLLELRPENA